MAESPRRYCEPADVRLALWPTPDGAQVSTEGETAAELSDNQILDACQEASAVVETYITVPSPVPPAIKFWTRNIAAYLITLTFKESQDITDTDPVVRRYIATMSMLEKVAKGELDPQWDTEEPEQVTAGAAGSGINPYVGNLFGPEDWTLGGNNWPFLSPLPPGGRW